MQQTSKELDPYISKISEGYMIFALVHTHTHSMHQWWAYFVWLLYKRTTKWQKNVLWNGVTEVVWNVHFLYKVYYYYSGNGGIPGISPVVQNKSSNLNTCQNTNQNNIFFLHRAILIIAFHRFITHDNMCCIRG